MEIKKIRLANGLQIFLWPDRHQKLTSVMIVVRAGSMLEKSNRMGTAHFLEHMYFKGSKNFPNANELHHALEKYGASVNASTSYEYTNFYATLPGRNLDFILKIFADILQNPLFPKDEVEKERMVILEELKMYEDDPRRRVWDLIYETLFGNQPAGWPIGGTKKTVSRVNREDLIHFYRNNYSGLNSALIISGNFSVSQKLLQELQTLFISFPKKRIKSQPKTKFSPKTKIKILAKENIQQAHIILGFTEAKKPSFRERIIYSHLQTILGQGLSSKLFQVLREDLACAYYVSADYDAYSDRHILTFHAGIELSQLTDALKKIIFILQEIKVSGVSDEEIFKSKNLLEASLIGSLETSFALTSQIASSFVLAEPVAKIEKVLQTIRSITKKEIQTASQKIFQPSLAGLALIYPESNQNLKRKLRKIISQL